MNSTGDPALFIDPRIGETGRSEEAVRDEDGDVPSITGWEVPWEPSESGVTEWGLESSAFRGDNCESVK